MKELGEYLKDTRKEHGVSLEEAASDLQLSVEELENIEDGNTRAFKDIYHMRHLVKDYAKYLGLEQDKVQDEFNDFLFEKTSKISLTDIMEAQQKKEEKTPEVKEIKSPYTKDYSKRIKIWPIVTAVILLALLITLIIIIINMLTSNRTINSELKGVIRYEYTDKVNIS